ncbi:uncharacterized protein V5649_010766 isoform 1-T1 [Rhynchonycteris naso]
MPTFSGQLGSHLNPSSRRPGGGRCKILPVALHEGSAERVSPSPRHPRRAPSSVSLKPALPAPQSPLGLPSTPRGPFQTPRARGGCSSRKRWPRLGPRRRDSERGGGGVPGTVSPATRRGRARRDAGSSRSTAGLRRRWEPRDRSITGSHGARAFSSLRAGASARHTSSGNEGPAPEPPRRAARRVLGGRCERSRPLPPQPARPHPAAPVVPAGGGRGRRRLLSRRRWWPDGLVQRLQLTPFKGTRGGVGRCRQTGRQQQQHHEFQFPGARSRHDMSQASFVGAWRSLSSARRTWALLWPVPPLPPRRVMP